MSPAKPTARVEDSGPEPLFTDGADPRSLGFPMATGESNAKQNGE